MGEEEQKKAELFYKMSYEGYTQVLRTGEQLDEKVHNLLKISLTITPIILGITYFILNAHPIYPTSFNRNYYDALFIFLGVSLFLFVFSIILGTITYLPKTFNFIDPQKLIDEYKKENSLFILQRIAYNLADVTKSNNELYKKKSKIMVIEFLLNALGVGFLLVAFILLILIWKSGLIPY
jgi:Na+/alanine symporter